jgi:hypothetical protein
VSDPQRRPFEAAWCRYRSMLVPADASDAQVRETRIAFYAGASIVYDAVLLMGDEDVSENVAMVALERMGLELAAFRDGLRAAADAAVAVAVAAARES